MPNPGLPAPARQIGFDWVCFFASESGEYFHNPFPKRRLHQSDTLPNWLCFFKIPCFAFRTSCFGFPAHGGRIGFVFSLVFSQYASRRTQYEINWLCFFTIVLRRAPALPFAPLVIPHLMRNLGFPACRLDLSAQGSANWLCFFAPQIRTRLHNPCSTKHVRQFGHFAIGFVFSNHDIRNTSNEIRKWLCFFTKAVQYAQFSPPFTTKMAIFDTRHTLHAIRCTLFPPVFCLLPLSSAFAITPN